jgi:hypothetical protein
MKLILIAILLVCFCNDPSIILSLDDDHSIGLLSEHGLERLVFFHRSHDSDTSPGTYLAVWTGEDHHEVHLSSSSGLIQKKLQRSSYPTEISQATHPGYSVKPVSSDSAITFEPDIGSADPPFQVLRI